MWNKHETNKQTLTEIHLQTRIATVMCELLGWVWGWVVWCVCVGEEEHAARRYTTVSNRYVSSQTQNTHMYVSLCVSLPKRKVRWVEYVFPDAQWNVKSIPRRFFIDTASSGAFCPVSFQARLGKNILFGKCVEPNIPFLWYWMGNLLSRPVVISFLVVQSLLTTLCFWQLRMTPLLSSHPLITPLIS